MGWGMKRDSLDATVSDLVRYRDEWTCLKCRRHYAPFAGLECSHFKSRQHKSTRYDPENCDTLCGGCHSHFTKNPDVYRAWRIQRFGEQRIEVLDYKARHPFKITAAEREWLHLELKKQLAKYVEAFEKKYPNYETLAARADRMSVNRRELARLRRIRKNAEANP
jgi:hypothetical protein